MSFDPLTAILDVGGKIIDKIFPDPEQRDRAKLELLKASQDGELKDMEIRLSAILAEAKSSDPWTSRARPAFLYVMYILILASIPMGILSAFNPDTAKAISEGMHAFLTSLPTELYWLFGSGYTGYTVARSAWDKKRDKNA